jgi:hypothetical protein
MCSDDASCIGSKKCCSNGCGHSCMEPAAPVVSGELLICCLHEMQNLD